MPTWLQIRLLSEGPLLMEIVNFLFKILCHLTCDNDGFTKRQIEIKCDHVIFWKPLLKPSRSRCQSFDYRFSSAKKYSSLL